MRNEWFYEPQPPSRFVIQEHLRQAVWRSGLSSAWVDVDSTEEPYRATVRWRDMTYTLEWETAKRLTLRASRPDDELIDVWEHIIGFEPLASYTQGDEYVVEWWRRREEREARWEELEQDEALEDLERHIPTPLYS